MPETLDDLQIQITAETSKAEKSITDLQKSLQQLKSLYDTVSKFGSVTSGLKSFATSLDKLSKVNLNQGLVKSLEDLSKLNFSNMNLGNAAAQIMSVTAALNAYNKEAKNKSTPTTGENKETSDKVDVNGLTVAQHNRIEMERYANSFSIGKFLKTAKNEISSFIATAFPKLQSFASGVGTIFSKIPIVSTISGMFSKIGGLLRSFSRIFSVKIIRQFITKIMNSVKASVGNLYQWSLGAGDRFSASMNMISTDFQYLGNSLIAAVSPLINALAPAFDTVTDSVVTLINAFNQLMAKITGQSYWTKATKTQKNYADAVTASGSAAKKAALTIASFDELHTLNSDTSSGSGGGSATTDYGSMFDNIAMGNQFSFVDQIKQAISGGDWQGAGSILADNVNSMFASIDWSGIGSKIGTYLNNAFEFAFGFLKDIDAGAIGKDIANFLNNAIGEIDFKAVGGILGQSVQKAFDFCFDGLNSLDWSAYSTDVSDAINSIFSNIDFVDIAQSASNLVVRFFNFISNAVSNIDWQGIGNDIADFLLNIDWFGILSSVMQGILDVLSGLLEGALTFVMKILANIGSAIWAWLTNLPKGLDAANEAFMEKFTDTEDFVITGLDNTGTTAQNSLNFTLAGMGGSMDSFSSDTDTALGKVNSAFGTFTNNMSTHGGHFTSDVDTNMAKVKGSIETTTDDITTHGKKGFDTYAGSVSGALSGIVADVDTSMKTISDKVGTKLTMGGIEYPYIKTPHFSLKSGSWSWNPIDWIKNGIPKFSVNWYAKGGFPNTGDIFVANEAGPEMVGSMGGKNAVANNTQIIEGIKQGVKEAMSESNGNVNVYVSLDGKQLGKNGVDYINSIVKTTGKSPLLV